MDEFPIITGVKFSVEASSAPWECEEEFVHEITGEVFGMINDTDEGSFGTIKLLKVSLAQADNRQMSLAGICDAHSEFLEAVFNALFDSKEEPKEDLEIEPVFGELLVLWEFNVAPSYRKCSIVPAFETAISLFGPQDLVVAAQDGANYSFIGLKLTVEEWKELGFVKVAGTQFVFRDNAKINPYKKPTQSED